MSAEPTVLFTLPIGVYYSPGWWTIGERPVQTTDDGMNAPDVVWQVPVILVPDLDVPGRNERGYGGLSILLREWDMRVLIHEIGHVALDHMVWKFDGTVEDLWGKHNHWLVRAVEVALAPLIPRLAAEDAARAAEVAR